MSHRVAATDQPEPSQTRAERIHDRLLQEALDSLVEAERRRTTGYNGAPRLVY